MIFAIEAAIKLFLFFGIDLPLTMTQLLWINIVMDTLAAFAFSGEAALKRYMNEKPIPKGESLISGDMWSAILIDGIFMAFGITRYGSGQEEPAGLPQVRRLRDGAQLPDRSGDHAQMIKLTRKLPWSFTLAVSGGPDSMAALDFFKRGKKQFHVVHVNHGTAHASADETGAVEAAAEMPAFAGACTKPPDESSAPHMVPFGAARDAVHSLENVYVHRRPMAPTEVLRFEQSAPSWSGDATRRATGGTTDQCSASGTAACASSTGTSSSSCA